MRAIADCKVKNANCKMQSAKCRMTNDAAFRGSAICHAFCIFHFAFFILHSASLFCLAASPSLAADDAKGRHSLRFRLEVRRRPLRPDGRRHDLEEALARGRVHRARVDARRARLLREPQAEAVARDGPRQDEEDRPRTISARRSASGEASSGRRATEGEIYDLVIKCVDFSAKPEPKVIYEVKARTKSVSEIPHLYVKQMLDALVRAASPAAPAGPDPVAEENWKKNPNLVAGDFEQRQRRRAQGLGQSGRPAARAAGRAGPLDGRGGQSRQQGHPLHARPERRRERRRDVLQRLLPRRGGREVSLPVPLAVRRAGREGLHQVLRRQRTEERRRERRREVYRSQQNLKGPNGTWNTQTEDFTPKHTKYSPKWGRVMLYAYLSPGVVEFDDVVVKQIVPPPPAKAQGAPPFERDQDHGRGDGRERTPRREAKSKGRTGPSGNAGEE